MSKVWTTYNTRVEAGLDKSLKDLGLDYVDLFLVVSFPLWQGDVFGLLTIVGASTGPSS